ncbi:conserved hypothetical protein [Clavispora lusitaniae ATCC 42720]|uniref:Uncharacterized protein n=1 Tax=Clavispora lusitaniae (strain ATCC 42720) TaxID=306902 RepID=C4YAW8_CLAL4|nr:uncharacterized protein CLUG_05433 [Clavispora lusitaniae ATCC 42720]EEQ41305.1 conserved hypothetical protein [Clavispora lusitaniae ATCC 42720]
MKRGVTIHGLSVQLSQDSISELGGGSSTTNVLGSGGTFSNDIVSGLGDLVGVLVQAQVSQHHGGRQNHSGWVGGVLALDVQTNVSATWLENGVFSTEVGTWNQTWTTNQGSTNVGKNRTVQVWSHQNVKSLRLGNGLHRSIVDNQVVDFDAWVVSADVLDGLSEQTVTQLHDVGLVDGSNQLSVVLLGKVKGELGNSLRLESGHDLQGLNDTWNRSVLQARVFTFGVFSDQGKVNAVQSGLDTWDVLDQNQRSVDVQLLSQGNVQRSGSGVGRGVQDTFQTNLVSLQRLDGLGDTLVVFGQTGNINNFPFDWDTLVLEDGLHRVGDFLTNTVTWNQSDSVGTAILLWQHGLWRCKGGKSTDSRRLVFDWDILDRVPGVPNKLIKSRRRVSLSLFESLRVSLCWRMVSPTLSKTGQWQNEKNCRKHRRTLLGAFISESYRQLH